MAGKHGGPRPNSGRKSMIEEGNVKELIRKATAEIGGEEAFIRVWKMILEKALAGSDKHAQILLNYYHGKPKENLEQPTEMIINVIRKH
jgi:hypothetical protein